MWHIWGDVRLIGTCTVISCSMKQTVHVSAARSSFSLPLMQLALAFGNSFQPTEQWDAWQTGTEREDRHKETGTDIERARFGRDEKDPRILWFTQFSQTTNFLSPPFVLNPLRVKGFILSWRVCLHILCCFQPLHLRNESFLFWILSEIHARNAKVRLVRNITVCTAQLSY